MRFFDEFLLILKGKGLYFGTKILPRRLLPHSLSVTVAKPQNTTLSLQDKQKFIKETHKKFWLESKIGTKE